MQPVRMCVLVREGFRVWRVQFLLPPHIKELSKEQYSFTHTERQTKPTTRCSWVIRLISRKVRPKWRTLTHVPTIEISEGDRRAQSPIFGPSNKRKDEGCVLVDNSGLKHLLWNGRGAGHGALEPLEERLWPLPELCAPSQVHNHPAVPYPLPATLRHASYGHTQPQDPALPRPSRTCPGLGPLDLPEERMWNSLCCTAVSSASAPSARR